MSIATHYEVLGAHRQSTSVQIRKLYVDLARKLHPDVGGDKDAFRIIAQAYSVLCDDKKRQNYNAWLDDKGVPCKACGGKGAKSTQAGFRGVARAFLPCGQCKGAGVC